MPRGTQVPTACTAGVITSSVRIWSTPSTPQVPLCRTSRCLRKFLAGALISQQKLPSELLWTIGSDLRSLLSDLISRFWFSLLLFALFSPITARSLFDHPKIWCVIRSSLSGFVFDGVTTEQRCSSFFV